jgi:Laminin G domain.
MTGPVWANGPPGGFGSLSFDGADDWVEVQSISGLVQVSLSAWVKTTSAAQKAIMDRDDGTTLRVWQFRMDVTTGLARVILFNTGGSNGQATTSSVINDGKWHWVAATWDGATIQMYLDGLANGTPAAFSGSLATHVKNIAIAQGSGGTGSGYWSGSLDGLEIWNVGLAAPQIWNRYQDAIRGYPLTLNRYMTPVALAAAGPPPPFVHDLMPQICM